MSGRGDPRERAYVLDSGALIAKPLGATIVTSDPDDIRLLANAAEAHLPVLAR